MKRKHPVHIGFGLGLLCDAGQHLACDAVAWLDREYGDYVFICACGCHPRDGAMEPRFSPEKIERLGLVP